MGVDRDVDPAATLTIIDKRLAAVREQHRQGTRVAHDRHPGTATDVLAQGTAMPTGRPAPLAYRTGKLISIEGVWGTGKSTVSGLLAERLTAAGFDACVLHDGPQPGVIGMVSEFLDTEPLRRRTGAGGYSLPHHASVDVFLRMCREAHRHTRFYWPALQQHDVVILDQGVFAKLAYYQVVLREHHPGRSDDALLGALMDCVRPWFLLPDQAFYLDVPWPLARERSTGRSDHGPATGSLERLLFLPDYDQALRSIASTLPRTITRITVGARSAIEVTTAIEREVHRTVLHVPAPPGSFT